MWLAPLLFVFLCACWMFFANLGDYPLFNPDESLYAEPAREMLDTGEYITTLLNYVVRFTKPPLVIWAMAASYKIFGVNEFAARYFVAACGAVLVAVTYLFVEKYANRRTAMIASFSLLTAPLFVGTAREAITDMPLALFIAGALMALFHGFRQNIGYWRWIGYALIGLAVMTKGPVGLILPAGIMVAFHLLRSELKAAWLYYKPFFGLAVIAAIALPWFATEIYVTKGAYYQEFLVRENFQRFTSVVDHKGAWWYHIAAVAGGFFPWTLFVPQAFWNIRRSAFGRDQSPLSLFCAVTFLATLVFFSISVSKLLPYTLPGFPFLAVLVALYLDKQLEERRIVSLALPFGLIALAGTVALYVVPPQLVHLREMPAALPGIIEQLLVALRTSSLVALVAVLFQRQRAALGMMFAAVFVCFQVSGMRALDVLSDEWEAPVQAFSQYAALSGEPIVVWHMRKPSITFYAGRQVIIPLDRQQLRQAVESQPRVYIIGKTADLPALASLPDCRLLVKQGRFVLLTRQASQAH